MDIIIKKEYFKKSAYTEYSNDLTLNALGISDISAVLGGGTLLKFNFGTEEVELKTDLVATITMLANLIQDANMVFNKAKEVTTTVKSSPEPHYTAENAVRKKTWSRRKKKVETQNPNESGDKNTQNPQEPVKKAKRPYHWRTKKNAE